MTGLSTENCALCTHGFVRESKDPAEMTHAKMALVERGLGAKQAHANHSQHDGSMQCVHAHADPLMSERNQSDCILHHMSQTASGLRVPARGARKNILNVPKHTSWLKADPERELLPHAAPMLLTCAHQGASAIDRFASFTTRAEPQTVCCSCVRSAQCTSQTRLSTPPGSKWIQNESCCRTPPPATVTGG